MAKTQSTFPTTIDATLQTDRGSGDLITSDSYDIIEDAIFQLETKVGVDSSAVAGTIDYIVKHASGLLKTHSSRHVSGGADILGGQFALARAGNAQSLPDVTTTMINIDTDIYDVFGIVDTTNKRILPTVAGYYFCFGEVYTGLSQYLMSYVYKNGALTLAGFRTTSTGYGSNVWGIMSLDGVDDYIDLRAYHATGAAVSLVLGTSLNYLGLFGPL